MSDLQSLQSRLGFAGCSDAVRGYQSRYVEVFPAGARVLDVGCGEGIFLDLLRRGGRLGLGVDSSETELEKARGRGLEVVHRDALEYLATAKEEFDGIFCAHLIEHLPPDLAVEMLRSMRTALKPSGCLVLITPDPLDLEVLTERFWLDLTHVRPYPRALLTRLLDVLGFKVLKSGNDDHTMGPTGWRSMPGRLRRRLRFGRHTQRGDLFVIAERLG